MRRLGLSLILLVLVGCGGAQLSGGCAGNDDCGTDQYCQLEACGNGGGSCAARPQLCTEIFLPVCGCDGKTYSNACNAAAQGASVAANSACSSDSQP